MTGGVECGAEGLTPEGLVGVIVLVLPGLALLLATITGDVEGQAPRHVKARLFQHSLQFRGAGAQVGGGGGVVEQQGCGNSPVRADVDAYIHFAEAGRIQFDVEAGGLTFQFLDDLGGKGRNGLWRAPDPLGTMCQGGQGLGGCSGV